MGTIRSLVVGGLMSFGTISLFFYELVSGFNIIPLIALFTFVLLIVGARKRVDDDEIAGGLILGAVIWAITLFICGIFLYSGYGGPSRASDGLYSKVILPSFILGMIFLLPDLLNIDWEA